MIVEVAGQRTAYVLFDSNNMEIGFRQEIIDAVYNYLKELNHFDEILITRAGGVISSHCGSGTLGVLYLGK